MDEPRGSLELRDAGGAEIYLTTVGSRPDLAAVLERADARLGPDADVLVGGPQLLLDGVEDRAGGRRVERMTWSM